MLQPRFFAVAAVLLCSMAAAGKNKKRSLLPSDVLRARNVLIVVDPVAGIDAQDPMANRTAREEVVRAIVSWGRLNPVTDASTADLIIVVRKGSGKMAQPTIAGTPVNGTPPASIGSTTGPTSSTTRAAGRWGNSGVPGDPSNTQQPSGIPSPQLEVGSSQDSFVVYRVSHLGSDLDAPPVWRYVAKDALASPGVPAVEVFRDLMVESDKQLASGP